MKRSIEIDSDRPTVALLCLGAFGFSALTLVGVIDIVRDSEWIYFQSPKPPESGRT